MIVPIGFEQPGDVIGFSGRGLVSDLINVATYGCPRVGLSHVAIVAEYRGQLVLFESTTLDDEPCLITGRRIHGVQAHPLVRRIKGYAGAAYHYPLCRALTTDQSKKLTEFLVSMIGRPYDDIGAFRSGGEGFSYIESWLRPANLNSIFCSELVAAAHKYVGAWHPRNESSYNPNRLVRTELRDGVLRVPWRLEQ
jgi:hypothetical protein